MNKRPMRIVLLLMLATAEVAACADRAPFVLKDSGFEASSQHRIFWLDNTRVIFTGYEGNLNGFDKRGQYKKNQSIYIWDTRENRRTLYVRSANLGCYFQGYLRYSIFEGPSKKGLMGQERTYQDMHFSKETWEGEPPEWEAGVRMHPITCRSYRSHGAMGFVDLLPEHGYLDYRRPPEYPHGDRVPIVWYRPGVPVGVKLPIMVHQYLDSSSVRYEEFMNGYVIGATNSVESTGNQETTSSPKDLYLSIWVLSPDDKTKEIKVPHRDWMGGGARDFFPARNGVFSWTHIWGNYKQSPGDAGGYWIQGEKLFKVISEEIAPDSIRVSPDGCKIAFVSEPYENRRPYSRNSSLQLLHVCKEE